MKVYTYSEARQRLASLLDQARREGKVQIRRRDGQLFAVQPVAGPESPLDVPPVNARLRRGELEEWVLEARGSVDHFWNTPPRTRRRPDPPRKPKGK